MIRQVIKTICRTNENIAGRHLADDKFHEILFIWRYAKLENFINLFSRYLIHL